MKFIYITAIVLICCLLIVTPASAEIYENEYNISTYSYDQGTYPETLQQYTGGYLMDQIRFGGNGATLLNWYGCYYIGVEFYVHTDGTSYAALENKDYGEYDARITKNGITYATGTLRYNARDEIYAPMGIDSITIHFEDWDVQSMIDDGYNTSTYFDLEIDGNRIYTTDQSRANFQGQWNADRAFLLENSTYTIYPTGVLTICAFRSDWNAGIYSDWRAEGINTVDIVTDKYTLVNTSPANTAGYEIYSVYGSQSFDYIDLPIVIYIENPDTGTIYTEIIGAETVESVDILTKVWSIDGPLIAGVEINFTAVDDSDQVIETLSTGQGIVTLIPDLTYYVSATAEGYREQSNTIDTVTFSTLSTNYGHFLVPILNASAGNGTLNFQAYTYTKSGSLTPLEDAMIVINNRALMTNSVGHASIEVNRTDTISYVASKTGYESVTRTYTPSWPDGYDYILEVVTLREEGYVGPGEESPEETPDPRTDNEKAESAFSMIMDNIEGLTALGLCVVIMSFIGWIKP